MTSKTYIVEGRQFRTEADYNRAVHDKEIIEKLRRDIEGADIKQLQQLRAEVHSGKWRFMTMLGQDFEDELEEMIRKAQATRNNGKKNSGKKTGGKKTGGKKATDSRNVTRTEPVQSEEAVSEKPPERKRADRALDAIVQEELKKREKRRKLLIAFCGVTASVCLGYYGIYSYYDYRTSSKYSQMNELKDRPVVAGSDNTEPIIHYTTDEDAEPREVLDEFKNLLIKNKKLIGWLTIDDTNIDYPVMQTTNNEYYLNHNLNQEYDKNGSIFMDKDCDVVNPSTNYILYGHHMRNGQMFGKLDLYSDESYYKDHQYIQFDTIYEKGIYQIMYVFRSRVYSEEEIVFKYYQFIDAISEQEFDSNMQEMANMSLYDTGVTAQYGDHLLTLSTCDYQEENGRFVVVAKKVAAKE